MAAGARQFCSRGCTEAFGLQRVRCSWPGCTHVFETRVFERNRKGRTVLEYKVDLTRKGVYTRHPICDTHRALVAKHLGDRVKRTTGLNKWLADPEADLGCRAISVPLTRLMVFAKTDGHCQDCGVALVFDGPSRNWHVDHRVPVFMGGKTQFGNVRAVCEPCHDKKTASEKSIAAKSRHQAARDRRWLTHPQKDELINRLRRENEDLRRRIADLERQRT